MKELIPQEVVERRILFIRGQKVMLDRDLAGLYGVPTKRLNEQVKRNTRRFPEDFMFQLTDAEKEEVVAICDHLKILKFSSQLPYAFTEQGVAMLSSVINSERAIQVNIAIMRAFVRLKQAFDTHKELAEKLKELEGEVGKHNKLIIEIFEIIKQLTQPPLPPPKPERPLGFGKPGDW
jgi:hypothetical protein